MEWLIFILFFACFYGCIYLHHLWRMHQIVKKALKDDKSNRELWEKMNKEWEAIQSKMREDI